MTLFPLTLIFTEMILDGNIKKSTIAQRYLSSQHERLNPNYIHCNNYI